MGNHLTKKEKEEVKKKCFEVASPYFWKVYRRKLKLKDIDILRYDIEKNKVKHVEFMAKIRANRRYYIHIFNKDLGGENE